MCYDVSQSHRQALREIDVELNKIRSLRPNDYYNDPDWSRLIGEKTRHINAIRDYERKIKAGVKF